ncbi:MAG: hypothetical protein IH855_13720, partial [Bacteroidetes bacterium]|nr:hypothetical protein [Bacteroidota bacterium]
MYGEIKRSTARNEKIQTSASLVLKSSAILLDVSSEYYSICGSLSEDLEGALAVSTGQKAEIRCIEEQQKSRIKLGGFLPFKWIDYWRLGVAKDSGYWEIPREKCECFFALLRSQHL